MRRPRPPSSSNLEFSHLPVLFPRRLGLPKFSTLILSSFSSPSLSLFLTLTPRYVLGKTHVPPWLRDMQFHVHAKHTALPLASP